MTIRQDQAVAPETLHDILRIFASQAPALSAEVGDRCIASTVLLQQAELRLIMEPSFRMLLFALRQRFRGQRLLLTPEMLTFSRAWQRIAIGCATLFLVRNHDDLVACMQVGVSRQRICMLSGDDLDPLLALPVWREPAAALRLLFVGDVSVQSGAADLFFALAAWAADNPEQTLQITWAGEGDMRGPLEAQPHEPNFHQRFIGSIGKGELVHALEHHGILVVPDPLGLTSPPVVEAQAAGVAVIGSVKNPSVCGLVGHASTGWVYDPRKDGSLTETLRTALAVPPDELSQIRRQARFMITAIQARVAHPGLVAAR